MWVRLQGISDVNGETIKLRVGHDFLKDDSPPYTPVVGSYLISHDLTLDVSRRAHYFIINLIYFLFYFLICLKFAF